MIKGGKKEARSPVLGIPGEVKCSKYPQISVFIRKRLGNF